MNRNSKKMKELNFKERLDQLREDFLAEIEKGNFELSKVGNNGVKTDFTITSNGLSQSCFTNSRGLFSSYGFTEIGIFSIEKMSHSLMAKLEKLNVDAEIKKLQSKIDELEKLRS